MKTPQKLALTIAFLGLTSAAMVWQLKNFNRQFNQARWMKVPEPGETYRLAMIDDLLIKHHLKNRSRSEVRTLLGPPAEYVDTKPNEDWYLLEEEQAGLSPDPGLLVHLVLRYEPGTERQIECGINRYEKNTHHSFKKL